MQFKIALSFLSVIFVAISAQEPDKSLQTISAKILGAIGSSRPMRVFDKWNGKLLKSIQRSELASQEYQILGKEAQEAVGIPEKHHVPIVKGDSEVGRVDNDLLMSAYLHEIAIYERSESLSLGAKRASLFHEAIHRKYCDGAIKLAVGMGSSCLVGVLSTACAFYILDTQKLLGRELLRMPLIIPTGLGLGIWGIFVGDRCEKNFKKKFSPFFERRADIEGCYATGCYQCVRDVECIRGAVNPRGYISADEVGKIADDLKSQNKLCAYHKE